MLYVIGEINPKSFLSILNSVCSNNTSNGTFVGAYFSIYLSIYLNIFMFLDLGCGTGLAVLATAFSAFEFERCWGIEIVPGLVEAGQSCLTHFLVCQASAKQVSPSSLSSANRLGGLDVSAGGKKKTKNKANESPVSAVSEAPDDILLSVVLDVLFHPEEAMSEENMNHDIEKVVALLCKRLGHKEYKKMLKGKYKTFKKFVILHPDSFTLIDDNSFAIIIPKPHVSSYEDIPQDATLLTEEKEISELAELIKDCDVGHRETDHNRDASIENEIVDILKNTYGGRYLLQEELPHVQLDQGDIFQVDWWSAADVVYCASLLFSEEMMIQLSVKVKLMKEGSYFITLKPFNLIDSDSQYMTGEEKAPLSYNQITLVADSFYKMSWQMARVYIYQKI